LNYSYHIIFIVEFRNARLLETDKTQEKTYYKKLLKPATSCMPPDQLLKLC